MPHPHLHHPASLLIAALALLASCSSTGVSNAAGRLVEYYDLGLPTGAIELEIERDGSVREMEVEVDIATVPEAVRAAAERRLPDGRLVGAEREANADGEFWELKLIADGVEWQFVIDEDGDEVLESEQPIAPDSAPEGVVGNAASLLRSLVGEEGALKSVDQISRGDEVTEYHIKFTIAGASYKVVCDASGATRRAVREHRAEIEIPLQ